MVANYLTKLACMAACLAHAVFADCGTDRPATAQFQVLSYNDVYELNPETDDAQYGILIGGPSRVIPIAKKLRQTYENSLILFAGDTMSPSLWSGQFKGLQMIEAHNALGVDFACLGNHEFDFGIEGFYNVSQASKFTWLNANTFEQSNNKLLRGTQPYAVKTLTSATMGTVKIGLFGVMYDMKDPSTGLYWTDPIQAAKDQVKILREQEKVDIVIALTHQVVDDDNVFSENVKGVDVIYGAHDHTAMLQTNYGPPFLKSDLNFRSIWLSDIKYYAPTVASGASKAAFTKMSHKSMQITGSMPTDPAFDTVIQTYSDRIAELFKRKVGSLCRETDFRKNLVRFSAAPIGNFFADAIQNFYGKTDVDVAIHNGGGIRSDKLWPAGDITLGDIISWDPFGNIITIISTDGASLKKFITSQMVQSCGANKLFIPNGFYTHVAGIYFEFQCKGQNDGSITKMTWTKKGRTGDVLDSDKVILAFSDFMMGLFDLAGGKGTSIVTKNEGARFEVLLEKHIDDNGGSVCPDTSDIRSKISW